MNKGAYIDPTTGQEIPATDPRTLATKEERIAAAKAQREAFHPSVHAYVDSRHDELCRCEGCRPQPPDCEGQS